MTTETSHFYDPKFRRFVQPSELRVKAMLTEVAMKKSPRRKDAYVAKPPETKLRPRADLKKIYDHAHQLLEQLKTGGNESKTKYGTNAKIDAKAKVWKINSAQLRKRLLFVEMYRPQDLKRLLKLKSLTWALTWAHVQKLLTVKDRRTRHKFAENAYDNGWSVHSLACEIEAWRRSVLEDPVLEASKETKSDRTGVRQGGRSVRPRPMSPGTLQELIQVLAKTGRLLAAFHDRDTEGMARPTNEDQPQCKQMRGEVIAKIKDLVEELEEFSVEFKRTVVKR